MLVEKLKEIQELLDLAQRDAEKAEAGNKSAGTRLRKDAISATKKLKELRQLVLDLREEKE